MALTTKYPGHITIADDPDNIIFGTCMLGETYGSVESASIKRGADLEEIKKCGGKLLAAIMRNMHFELTLKCIFTDDVTAPGLGEMITFPMAGIKGRIVPTVDVEWEKEGHRMISINAKSWDALSDDGAGLAKAYDGVNPVVDLDTP